MPDARPNPKNHGRKVYVVDRPSQASVAWNLLGVLVGIGVLYAFAIFFLLSPEALRDMSVDNVRQLMLTVHVAYFAVGSAILAVWALLVAHRFSGPAFVMRRAIKAMRQGDFTQRLSLRKRDYHQELAKELAEFGAELAARSEIDRRLLQTVRTAVDEGDTEGAKAAIAKALGVDEPKPSEVAVPATRS